MPPRLTRCARAARLLACIALALPAWATSSPAVSRDVAKPTVDPAIFGHVARVGWVVRDLDRTLAYWKKLGLKNIRAAGTQELPDTTYRGRTSPIVVKTATAVIGSVQIRWIQPLRGVSAFDTFLAEHGDGIHHLTYAVSGPEQLAQQARSFEAKGVGVLQEGVWGRAGEGGRYLLLDTAVRGGGLTIALADDRDDRSARAGGAAAGAENAYPFSKITQYALVVRDVRRVSEYLAELGLGGLAVEHFVGNDRKYRGRVGRFEADLGWNRHGDVPFEWVQATSGPSIYGEHLEKHGEGVHHLAFDVGDMDAAVDLLARRGARVAQSGGWAYPNSVGRYAYLDTEPYGGVTIELLWNKPQEAG